MVKISIVITTHKEALEDQSISRSILLQKYNKTVPHSRDKRISVKFGLGDYCYKEYTPEIIFVADGGFNPYSEELPADDKIVCFREGGVGHHTRSPGIEAATGDFIVLTNSDNYFMQGWLDRVQTNIVENTGMVVWDHVTNLWRWGTRPSKIQRGEIDLSCVAVRADISKKIGFPFRDYDGDFDYIEACADECKKLKLKIVKLPEILCVHN